MLRRAIGQSLASFIRLVHCCMSLTSHCIFPVCTSRQHMTRSNGHCCGVCSRGWECIYALYSGMLGGIQSLDDGCLLSTRVGDACEHCHSLSIGMSQNAHSVLLCLTSSLITCMTIFKLHACVDIGFLQLSDWYMLMTFGSWLQLAAQHSYKQSLMHLGLWKTNLHMQIRIAKTEVMTVSVSASPPVAFTCNGCLVEQVSTFKYHT